MCKNSKKKHVHFRSSHPKIKIIPEIQAKSNKPLFDQILILGYWMVIKVAIKFDRMDKKMGNVKKT